MRYVGLLRGVNVGGKNKLPMAELRKALSFLPFDNLVTYIQSGNIVFDSDFSSTECSTLISNTISQNFNLNIPVVVFEQTNIIEILVSNPFKKLCEVEKKFMSFGFLDEYPSKENCELMESFSNEKEFIKITENIIFFYCTIGFGKTKLTNHFMEKKLKVSSTMRNYNTTLKLSTL